VREKQNVYGKFFFSFRPVAARHVLNVGGRHTNFSYFRPLAVFSLAYLAQHTKYIHLLSLHIHEYNK